MYLAEHGSAQFPPKVLKKSRIEPFLHRHQICSVMYDHDGKVQSQCWHINRSGKHPWLRIIRRRRRRVVTEQVKDGQVKGRGDLGIAGPTLQMHRIWVWVACSAFISLTLVRWSVAIRQQNFPEFFIVDRRRCPKKVTTSYTPVSCKNLSLDQDLYFKEECQCLWCIWE